jgi:hypothetical protein
MSSVNGHRGLLGELEEVEQVLSQLLEKLSNVNNLLTPLEHSLRAEDFSSSGSYILGTSNGLVCVLSGNIKGDPLSGAIEKTRGKGRKFPSIIKGADRSETKTTCDSILKIVKGKPRGKSIAYVVNLRWANMPSINDNAIVIGNRYYNDSNSALETLSSQFQKLGLKVMYDRGEFGGGPLTYRLTEFARKAGNMPVFEITLSRKCAENHERVADILESFTNL